MTPALRFIFITVFLDVMAFAMIIPALPRLVGGFVTDNTVYAALLLGAFGFIWALMQFLFSPLLGMLSDRYGRRPVILLSNLGLALDYIIMALAPSLSWLFVGRVLSGITSANIGVANAYISDIAPAETRSKSFGIINAAFGLGFLAGPALGGWLSVDNLHLPFYAAAGCSFLNALYGLFILPESLPPEKRQTALRWKSASPLGSLALLKRRHELIRLSLVNFLGNLAHEVYVVVFVLYVGFRYGWGSTMVGATLTAVGICAMVIAVFVIGLAVRRLGEYRTLIAGMACGAFGFLLFGWAPTGLIFLAIIPLNALWALAGPPVQTLMTQMVAESEQGELQGALASIRSLAMLAGPGIFSVVFALGLQNGMPGLPWYLAAVFVGLAGFLVLGALRAAQYRS